MRILLLNQYALPRGAPGITRHGDLGAELARRGHEVTVVASPFNYLTRKGVEGERRHELHSGVRFAWLDTGTYRRNDRNRIRSMVRYLLAATSLGMRTSLRPDVVIASSPHLFTGLAGALIAARHRAPFVFEVRDFWPSVLVDLGAVRAGLFTHRSLERLERWLYRRSRLVVFVPPFGRKRLIELGLDHVPSVHIPNAAVRASRQQAVPESLVRMLTEVGGRCVLMYMGAHGVANDLGILVDALDRLRADCTDVYENLAVVLVGDGGEKPALERRIESSGHRWIRTHPPIEKVAVPTALEAADLLLVNVAAATAHTYGLSPNKLFDYLLAARPVLISSHVATIVDEADAGIRYEPGDPGALAGAIADLVRCAPARRVEMGQRGRSLIESDYSLESVATRLERALGSVVHQ